MDFTSLFNMQGMMFCILALGWYLRKSGMIDKSGRTDADVYNAAHIDRRVFSKIRSSKDYQPKKETAMAFCIGLQLNMDDAKKLLGSAGYAFSNGSRQDLIVQFFIEHKNYDMNELNAALDHFGEKMLTI